MKIENASMHPIPDRDVIRYLHQHCLLSCLCTLEVKSENSVDLKGAVNGFVG